MLSWITAESVKWDMPATEYFSKLDDDASLLLHAAFLVEGTNQVWSQAKVIEVMKPEITVTVGLANVILISIHNVSAPQTTFLHFKRLLTINIGK